MERILVRMPGAKLGDYLVTTPALAGIRAAHPAAQITLLLWSQRPGDWLTDRSLYDETLWDDAKGKYAGMSGARQIQKEMRARRFDAFVSLHRSSRVAWNCFRANIPIRIGNSSRPSRILYTQNIFQDRDFPDRHEVEYNYDLTRPLGVTGAPGKMRFDFTPDDADAARKMLNAENIRERDAFLILNPTCGGTSRSWQPEGFIEMARRLARGTGLPFVLIGAACDREYNARLADALGKIALDFTGQTSVAVLAALLRRSSLHISVDTGTMHLAAAMETPCVTIFPFMRHWEQKTRWHPWQTAQRLVGPRLRCSDCVRGNCARTQNVCMDSIQPEDIVEAALELLAASNAPQPAFA